MERRFTKHYTLAEARELLPRLRVWLPQLQRLRRDLASYDQSTGPRLTDGDDFGGGKVNQWVRNLSAFKELLEEFNRREIQVKDLERGLVDFPAIQAGREVFLCWELEEADITHWHDLDSGYAGREKL
jgi:hypothetical protein